MSRSEIIFRALHTYCAGVVFEPTDERLRELSRYIDNNLSATEGYQATERDSFDGKTITITIR